MLPKIDAFYAIVIFFSSYLHNKNGNIDTWFMTPYTGRKVYNAPATEKLIFFHKVLTEMIVNSNTALIHW